MLKFSMKDNEIFMRLEIAHYEYESYSAIIEELELEGKYDDEFWKAWHQFIMSLGIYETIKRQLFIDFVYPKVGHKYNRWEANFDNGELIIYLE